MMNDEVWKPLPGFEKVYEVSSLGRVRRIKAVRSTYAGRIIKGYINADGYIRLDLRDNKRRKNIFAHRAVLLAFVGQCPPGCEVNHKDGDRQNNRLDNLEYLSHRDNIRYSYHELGNTNRGRSLGSKNGMSKLTYLQVVEIKRLLAEGKLTHKEIAERYPVGRTVICRINTGALWAHVSAPAIVARKSKKAA